MPTRWIQDPQSALDYKFDWGTGNPANIVKPWLAAGEVIATRVVTVTTGLNKDSDSITDSGKSVTVWLSAGTVGATVTVTCRIVTTLSRTDERTITVTVQQR